MLALRAQLVLLALLVLIRLLLALRDLLDQRARHQLLLAQLGPRGPRGLRGLRGLRVRQEFKALQARQDQLGLQVPLLLLRAPLALRGRQVRLLLGLQAQQAQQGLTRLLQALLDQLAPQDQLEQERLALPDLQGLLVRHRQLLALLAQQALQVPLVLPQQLLVLLVLLGPREPMVPPAPLARAAAFQFRMKGRC